MKKSKYNGSRRDLPDDKSPAPSKKAKSGGFNWGRKAVPETPDWKTADAEFASRRATRTRCQAAITS